ncbi:PDZ domain-containing protein [Oscillochloris sp. ZM17-4]|uniref:PDZ domain-containing protein n=1 Tax=Oscillochloris sp. ZM17-4 TaxID=2866714 RepID=UPI001C72D391|nr:PDZ domain-containing protein [Oscillochloris sp. ZM17-4]MBX0329651.1 PDZ domain-containing protein [Oscillochloris sp. ZM17-4]
MKDFDTSALESGLSAKLPADQRAVARHLAELLAAIAEGQISQDQAQQRIATEPALAQALRALAGQHVPGAGALISFGSGSQLGDVTIGDVVGRDKIEVKLDLGKPGLGRRNMLIIGGGLALIIALTVAILLQQRGANQDRIRQTRAAINADVITNIRNLDAQLLFVQQTLALAPSATATESQRQFIGEGQIASLRQALAGRPLRDDQSAAYAQSLISSGADASDVKSFYSDLAFTRDAAESLLVSMADRIRLQQADQARLAHAQQVIDLDARRFQNLVAITYMSGLNVLARSGYSAADAQAQLRDLLVLEPRILPDTSTIEAQLLELTQAQADLVRERLTLATESLDALASDQAVHPTDTPADVASKAIALRRTGEAEVAAAIFTYYGEQFAAEDPTAALYGRVGAAFSQQIGALNVVGGGYIFQVRSQSPAAQADLREGDIIIDVSGTTTETNVAVTDALGKLAAGTPAVLTILRLHADQTFERLVVTIAIRPLGIGLMPI